jgi:hypothetical protein
MFQNFAISLYYKRRFTVKSDGIMRAFIMEEVTFTSSSKNSIRTPFSRNSTTIQNKIVTNLTSQVKDFAPSPKAITRRLKGPNCQKFISPYIFLKLIKTQNYP